MATKKEEKDQKQNQKEENETRAEKHEMFDPLVNQEQLTARIREEVYKEVEHMLRDKYDVELEDEDRKAILKK